MHWHYAHASYLHLLWVAIPLASFFLWRIHAARLRARSDWSEKNVADRYLRPLSIASSMLNAACWLGIVALTFMAAAWPLAPDAPDQVAAGSVQTVCTFDVSWSMQGEDYRGLMPGSQPGSTVATGASGSRLQMARHLCEQVMHATSGSDMGLVVYQGKGFAIFPTLTSDYQGLKFIMDVSLRPGNAEGDGSYVANGLAEGIRLFDRAGDPKKAHIIVLFSDGGNDSKDEDLGKVVQALKERNIKLIVVGVGSHNEVQLPIYDDNTGQFVKWRDLKTSDCGGEKQDSCDSTKIDESFLSNLAKATDGEYHYVAPGETSIAVQWAAALHGDTLEPTGKPMFLVCLGGVAVLIIILSLPGLLRRRVTL